MKPIIFNTEMVRAILDGRKTQTRRIVTRMTSNVDGHGRANKETWEQLDFSDYYLDSGPSPAGNPGPYLKIYNPLFTTRHRIYPIWFPGDKLWVRETFWHGDVGDDERGQSQYATIYRADQKNEQYFENYLRPDGEGWKPSIHLPKKYSRITLEIKDVRVERINDITWEDVKAEGCDHTFMYLWNSINEKRGYGWDTNPWVWVVEFEVMQ